jgi:3',5'-cyclic AMP phosphodiesterase CpdA
MQHAHDVLKCLALPAAFDTALDLLDAPEDAQLHPVVVSGDLTVSGSRREFAVAQAFIRSRFPITRMNGNTDLMGLGASATHGVAIVPGNHDHWDGSRATLPPHNPWLYSEQFRDTPWAKHWTSADGSVELELYGVDSNSGWAAGEASTLQRRAAGALAQGRISTTQFSALESKLQAAGPRAANTARAIVCHHSLVYSGNTLRRGDMDPASRDRLLNLAAEFEVAAILTGHTHDPYAFRFHGRDSRGQYRPCHELRAACGVGFKDSPSDEIGFLAHRIGLVGGRLTWDSVRLSWSGTRYVPFRHTPWHSFAV